MVCMLCVMFWFCQVRELVQVISSGIQPVQQNSSILKHIGKVVGEEKAAMEKQKWAHHYIVKGFNGNKSYINFFICFARFVKWLR